MIDPEDNHSIYSTQYSAYMWIMYFVNKYF